MKKYILLLLLPFFALTCDNGNEFGAEPSLLFQVTVNDDALPQSLKDRYFEDAIALTLQHLNKTNDLENLPMEIPVDTLRMFYTALVDLHNASDTLCWDIFARLLGIRAYRHVFSRSVIVTIDSSYIWTNAWRRGELWTGDARVDHVLRNSSAVSVKQSASYLGNLPFEITLARSINTGALCAELKKIPGVLRATYYTWYDPTEFLTGEIDRSGVFLTYGVWMSDHTLVYTIFIDWKHRISLVR